MKLFVPRFEVLSEDSAVGWRMVGPTGRDLARGATTDATVEAARASIAHVVEAVDLFSVSLHRTATFRWQWVLSLDLEPVVRGSNDHDSFDRCERACRRFTLLAPLADVDRGGPVEVSRGRGGEACTSPRRPVLPSGW